MPRVPRVALPFRIGSLFSGVGGLELGLEWAGVGRTVWQVEKDKFCRRVLAEHWPHAERFDDVRQVGAANLPPADLICGGFPCADISFAGKGEGLAGKESGLWYEYERIVREMGPRFVVVENVAALRSRGLGVVLGALASLGYDAEWRSVRASDVGAPQRRERVFIIAWRRLADADRQRQLQQTRFDEEFGRRTGDGGEEVAHAEGARRARRSGESGDDGGRVGSSDVGGRPAESGMGRVPHGVSRWLDRWPARPGEEQHAWEPSRTVETAMNRSARLRALGNAVVPQVAREVGLLVRRIVAEQRGCT